VVATALVLAVLWAIGPPPVDSSEVRVQQLGLVDLGLVDLIFGVNFFFSVSTVWPLLPVSEAPNAVAVVARLALPSQNGDVGAVHDPDPAPDRVEYIDRYYSFDVFRFY
jgi:hypothetical protein